MGCASSRPHDATAGATRSDTKRRLQPRRPAARAQPPDPGSPTVLRPSLIGRRLGDLVARGAAPPLMRIHRSGDRGLGRRLDTLRTYPVETRPLLVGEELRERLSDRSIHGGVVAGNGLHLVQRVRGAWHRHSVGGLRGNDHGEGLLCGGAGRAVPNGDRLTGTSAVRTRGRPMSVEGPRAPRPIRCQKESPRWARG